MPAGEGPRTSSRSPAPDGESTAGSLHDAHASSVDRRASRRALPHVQSQGALQMEHRRSEVLTLEGEASVGPSYRHAPPVHSPRLRGHSQAHTSEAHAAADHGARAKAASPYLASPAHPPPVRSSPSPHKSSSRILRLETTPSPEQAPVGPVLSASQSAEALHRHEEERRSPPPSTSPPSSPSPHLALEKDEKDLRDPGGRAEGNGDGAAGPRRTMSSHARLDGAASARPNARVVVSVASKADSAAKELGSEAYSGDVRPIADMTPEELERERLRLKGASGADTAPLPRWNKALGPSFRISRGGTLMTLLAKNKEEVEPMLPVVEAFEADALDELGVGSGHSTAGREHEGYGDDERKAGPADNEGEAVKVKGSYPVFALPDAAAVAGSGPGTAGVLPLTRFGSTPRGPAMPAKASRLAAVTRAGAAPGPRNHVWPAPDSDDARGSLLAEGVPSSSVARGAGSAVTAPAEPATKVRDMVKTSVWNADADFVEMVRQRSWKARAQGIAKRIVSNQDFEFTVIVLIFANCITLSMYRPLEGDSAPFNSRLAMAELVFNVAFSVEVVLRFIADGGIRNYFREAWNVFDFLMVMAGYSSLLPVGNSNTGAIRALRALRALRPLRTITRFQSLRVIVVAFLESVPMIGQVTMLMFFVMVLFGISALSLFSGAFHYECYDPVTGQPETYPNPILPDEFGCGGWRTCPPAFPVCRHSSANLAINAAGFDNLATSLLTVFQIMTLGDACIVMYRVIDNTSWASALWFVALILFMTHLSLNLFLAVLKLEFGRAQRAFAEELKATRKSTKKTTFAKAINFVRAGMHNFVDRQRAKSLDLLVDASEGSVASAISGLPPKKLTEEQRVAIRQAALEELVNAERRVVVRAWLRLRLRLMRLSDSTAFNNFFLFVILVSTVFMASEYYGMSATYTAVLNVANYVTTALFCFELVIKMVGYTFWGYMSDGFNVFDLGMVLLSLLDIFFLSGGGLQALRALRSLRVIRSLRVLRIFKMFKYLQSLKKIGDVIMQSSGFFFSVAVLMILFMLVYTIIGLHTLGAVMLDDSWATNNFSSFVTALRSTFQLSTL